MLSCVICLVLHVSAEIEANREPYEEEKVLCSALLTYLQRYLVNDEEKMTSSSPEQLDHSPSKYMQYGGHPYVLGT